MIEKTCSAGHEVCELTGTMVEGIPFCDKHHQREGYHFDCGTSFDPPSECVEIPACSKCGESSPEGKCKCVNAKDPREPLPGEVDKHYHDEHRKALEQDSETQPEKVERVGAVCPTCKYPFSVEYVDREKDAQIRTLEAEKEGIEKELVQMTMKCGVDAGRAQDATDRAEQAEAKHDALQERANIVLTHSQEGWRGKRKAEAERDEAQKQLAAVRDDFGVFIERVEHCHNNEEMKWAMPPNITVAKDALSPLPASDRVLMGKDFLEKLDSGLDDAIKQKAELQATIARLTGALEKIAEKRESPNISMPRWSMLVAQQVAQKALAAEEGE